MLAGSDVAYAYSGDLAIAYRTFGQGERNFLVASNWLTNVEITPHLPGIERWIELLMGMGRVIFFDQPSTGASDPLGPDDMPTLEQWTDVAVAVLDATRSEQTVVLALDGAFAIGAMLAAMHPARTAALIVFDGYACLRYDDDYPIGMVPDVLAQFAGGMKQLWGTGEIEHALNPTMPWNDEIRRAWARNETLSASPGVVRRMIDLVSAIDVRDVLPSIHVPTLVIHNKGDFFFGVDHGRYIAEHIEGARLVELDSANLWPWYDSIQPGLLEIREFLTGVRDDPSEEERILTTVLFTDIVDSTRRASAMGDRDWKALLDAHDQIIRAELGRFRGREVKTVGDGFLATFDGPQRAIRCALASRQAVQHLGIQIRAGVHTGECEVRHEDVSGIAVHIGARVAAKAGASEVLVSSTVKDLVVGSGIGFDDRGAHELKGVPGIWQLFAVRTP